MISCEQHITEPCKQCKHYNECELTLPFTAETSERLNNIRQEIQHNLNELNDKKTGKTEKGLLRIEIRELRQKESRILKQLRRKRDREELN